MLAIDRRAARATWTVFLVALLLATLFLIRKTLLIFTVALLFAYLLSPMVDLVNRHVNRDRSRTVSLALVYLFLLAVLVTVGIALGTEIVQQATALAARLPQLVRNLEQPVELPIPAWAAQAIREQVEQHVVDILPFLQRAGREILELMSNLPFLVLVPVISFFLLKDGSEFRRLLLAHYIEPGPRRAVLEEILSDLHRMLAQFMRAIVILCFATFAFYGAFFAAIGMPYGILLATLAGFLEFIPVVGPLTASAAIVLVAIFTGFPHWPWIIVFLVAYRLLQDLILQPYLMSSGIALHPVLVIFGVMAGEQIAGIPGMFLSIPVLAALRVLAIRLVKLKSPAATSA
ncbi:MAG: AI-2E family transporter [Bryobacteraceae bacterium]